MEISVSLSQEQRNELCEDIVTAILAKISFHQPIEQDRKLTKKEAARALNVTEVTIDQYRRQGILPYQKLGARVYFKHSDIVNAGSKIRRHTLKVDTGEIIKGWIQPEKRKAVTSLPIKTHRCQDNGSIGGIRI